MTSNVRRVVVKGGSGAGKTTLARLLAERLGVEHVELDRLHHGPNWTSASAEQLQERVRAALNDEAGWVVDGNYDAKLGTLIWDRAELIVWLDLPLSTKLKRMTQRTFRRLITGEELWNGNRESLKQAFWGSDSLYAWALRMHPRYRKEWPPQFIGRNLVRLRTPAEVREWVEKFLEAAKR
jgi:adenylate kinase family enzyme